MSDKALRDEAEQTVKSLAYMLGWINVPPREVLERSLNALKAQARAATPAPVDGVREARELLRMFQFEVSGEFRRHDLFERCSRAIDALSALISAAPPSTPPVVGRIAVLEKALADAKTLAVKALDYALEEVARQSADRRLCYEARCAAGGPLKMLEALPGRYEAKVHYEHDSAAPLAPDFAPVPAPPQAPTPTVQADTRDQGEAGRAAFVAGALWLLGRSFADGLDEIEEEAARRYPPAPPKASPPDDKVED